MRQKNETLLRIGEVAGIVGVPVHTLRYWERMFKEDLSPYRSTGRQRIYSEVDIARIRAVKKLLKEEGYSINGVRKIFRNGVGHKKSVDPFLEKEPDWSAIALDVTRLIREKFYDR
jgi:DNA-binding transcriptional MerR regulator